MDVDGKAAMGQDLPGGKCGLRTADPFDHRTGGALFAYCYCGVAFPGVEVTGAESTSRILQYDLKLHSSRPGFLHAGNEYTYKSFDDMCHLNRLIESRHDQHPRLEMWQQQVMAPRWLFLPHSSHGQNSRQPLDPQASDEAASQSVVLRTLRMAPLAVLH